LQVSPGSRQAGASLPSFLNRGSWGKEDGQVRPAALLGAAAGGEGEVEEQGRAEAKAWVPRIRGAGGGGRWGER